MKSEKSHTIYSWGIFLLALVMLAGCKKTDKPASVLPSGNMAEVLYSSTAYWASDVALQRGGYEQMLTGPGPFTGFVVTNLGWRNAGFAVYAGINQTTGTTDTLSRINPLIMKAISGYMFGLGKLDTASLPSTVNGEIKTIDGNTLYCTKVSTTFSYGTTVVIRPQPYINGHAIQSINIPYPNNGILQEMSQIVLPPISTIAGSVDTIVFYRDTTLSYLKAAIIKASTATGAGSVNLSAILASAGPYTLFAPTNVAFRAYTGGIYNTLAKINALSGTDLDLLNRNLQFHIIPQRIFSSLWIPFPSTASAVNSFATLLPGKSVNIYGNSNIVGNGVTASIAPGASGLEINRTCTNGVIHKINAVLKSQ